MKFSEAISLGAVIRPQNFGSLFGERKRFRWFGEKETTSCALGAAFEAAGIQAVPRDQVVGGEVMSIRGGNSELPVYVVSEEWGLSLDASCPQCHSTGKLGNVVHHLNDDHRWTRQRIAAWVASEENARSLAQGARLRDAAGKE